MKSEDASWGDYPIDTFLIRNEPRTVHEILRRIDKGSFVMDPDFPARLYLVGPTNRVSS